MRILVSGLRKLVRRPASWVTLALAAGLLVLLFVAVGASIGRTGDPESELASRLLVTFPGAYSAALSAALSFGSLFALIYGAAVAGSEWSWGTLKNAVARGESRTLYTLGQYAAVLLLVMLGLVLAFVVGVIAAMVGSVLGGVPLDGVGDVDALADIPGMVVRGWIALGMSAAVGYAVATVARSQLAGIGVGVGLYFGEQLSRVFFPDIVQYLPFAAAGAVIASGERPALGGGGGSTLEPTTAVLVTLAWLLGSLAIASAVTERAEIGG